MTSSDAPVAVRILSVAVAPVDKRAPTQQQPVGLDAPLLVAPDGSVTTFRQMLRGYLDFTRFDAHAPAQPTRYVAKLHIEGGYFALTQGFADDVELFGVSFLFEHPGGAGQRGKLSAEPTERTALSPQDGLPLDLVDADRASAKRSARGRQRT